jgi:hypothetical protein
MKNINGTAVIWQRSNPYRILCGVIRGDVRTQHVERGGIRVVDDTYGKPST